MNPTARLSWSTEGFSQTDRWDATHRFGQPEGRKFHRKKRGHSQQRAGNDLTSTARGGVAVNSGVTGGKRVASHKAFERARRERKLGRLAP